MKHKSVTYRTLVKEISAVTLVGKVDFHDVGDDFDSAAWFVGDDRLEEWLEKFDGKTISLTIETSGQDESHLLNGTAQEREGE